MSETKKSFMGFRIRTISVIILLLTALVGISLLFTAQKVSESASLLQENTQKYIICQKSASDFLAASDFLTVSARSFVVTTELTDAQNYFKEIYETKRREKATFQLEITSDKEAFEKMLNASKYSADLEEREMYAIKLVCLARDYDMDALSPDLASIQLNLSDSSLSPAYKLVRARDVVYSNAYRQMKEYINDNVSDYLSTLIDETQAQQKASIDQFNRFQTVQHMLIIVLVIMLTLSLLFITLWVVRPLLTGAQNIQKQARIPVRGAREFRLFASSYNALFESNRIRQEELVYKANHDSLTGVNNREIFEKYYHEMTSSERSVLLLIDIDHFKEVNDTYGHQAGDRILVKTASLLQAGFRANDCVCRIGGDEFVVILLHAGLTSRALLRNKIKSISERLHHPTEPDLPAVTLSVGAAFGDQGTSIKELYKKADIALYQIKNNERNGIAFYDEIKEAGE